MKTLKTPLTAVEKQAQMRKRLFRICLTGILISLGMVTKLATSIPIPVLGPGGMKIGFSGIFTALPAFLFGPLYGGIASAMSDLIGAIVKPDGAYIPWLTLTAFLGGCIKGFLWRILRQASGRRTGALLLCVFLLLGTLGIGNTLSLSADGVVTSPVTDKMTVPSKDRIEEMKLSPLSSLSVSLATYQNDTFTLTAVKPDSTVIVPSKALIGQHSYAVKKIGANAFASCSEPLTVLLSGGVTSIDESAFGELKDVTILSPSSSVVSDFCEKMGFFYEATDMDPVTVSLPSYNELEGDGFTFTTNNTYRKYLSGYLNFMMLGLMLIGLIGSCTALILLLLQRKPASSLLLRVSVACILSGVIVTTANTEILRHFLAAYAGRSFLILWIPRLIEEIVVCFFQSYLIFLLLSIYKSRIKPKIALLRENVDI